MSETGKKNNWRVIGVAILFGATVLALLSIAGTALFTRARLNSARETVTSLQTFLQDTYDLRNLVIDAETGQRGFLITGDEKFLAPYYDALTEKSVLFERLSGSLAAFPDLGEDFPELTNLVEDRDRELAEAIKIRQTKDFSETVSVISAELSKARTELIRLLIARIQGAITARTTLAETEYLNQINRTTLITNLSAFTALGLGLFGLALLIGHLREQAHTFELEQQKVESERSAREKSRFLASMNHEIRTPLNAMLGFTELMGAEVSSPQAIRYLKAIRESGESLAELINDILDLSKIESGALELSPEPVNVREFTKGISLIFEDQARLAKLDFRIEVDPYCPAVLVYDGLRVRQILVNLIGNAFKFTAKGSIVGKVSAPPISPGICQLTFAVADTGRGISTRKLSLIFEPFKQAEASDEHKGGTGLGLSISRELATLMGGTLEVESTLEQGSEFRLVLPQVEIIPETLRTSSSSPRDIDFAQLAPSKILIVDDNAYNRELIAGYLLGSDHQLSYAQNGREALEKMRNDLPDLVLMDIRMPVMSGDTAREIILEDQKLSKVPVIAVTASSLLNQERRLRKMFDGYLRKPFGRVQLYEAMAGVLAAVSAVARPANSEESDPLPPAGPDVAPPSEAAAPAPSSPLLDALAKIHEKTWEPLSQSMVLSEVRSVSVELQTLAQRYSSAELAAYAGDLRDAADQFDQGKLETLLAEFPALRRSLVSLG